MRSNRRRTRWSWIGAALVLSVLGAVPAAAGLSVAIDAETLQDVLAAVTLDEVEVPFGGDRTLTVRLEELRILELVPAPDDPYRGSILTSMRIRVPEIGLDLRAEPRIALDVDRAEGPGMLRLRFEAVPVRLPLAGTIDIAPLLPPLRYPADSVWSIEGSRGDVPIVARLDAIRMGRSVVRFEFDIDVRRDDEP